MIVGGRLKGRAREAVMAGWEARNFHYVKDLKPLAEYLKTPDEQRADKKVALMEMFRRIKAKGERDGSR